MYFCLGDYNYNQDVKANLILVPVLAKVYHYLMLYLDASTVVICPVLLKIFFPGHQLSLSDAFSAAFLSLQLQEPSVVQGITRKEVHYKDCISPASRHLNLM